MEKSNPKEDIKQVKPSLTGKKRRETCGKVRYGLIMVALSES